MRRFSSASATKLLRTFVAAICLLTVHQPANAKGCLKGAMLGGIAGHMKHHTFLGIFVEGDAADQAELKGIANEAVLVG